jgi:methyl-accepting chemotaxis protein
MRFAADTSTLATEEIQAVKQAASRNAAAAHEMAGSTERLTSGAADLEKRVGEFFRRVRSA